MKRKRPDSLHAQLLRWLLLPLLGLFALNFWLSGRAATATANRSYDRLLAGSAEAIAEDTTVQDGHLVVDLPYAALELLESNMKERLFYRVLGSDGATVTGYDDLPLPSKATPSIDAPVFYTDTYRGDIIYLVALAKPLYGAAESKPALVIVAETGESREALSQQILLDEALRQGALIALAGIVLWFAVNRSLLPLTRLRDTLAAREPTDLSPIDSGSVQTEVVPLIDALNQHTRRLRKLLESREQFIADASHQMRTPLAEMRMQIDYTLRHDDVEQQRCTLQDLHRDVAGLGDLIGQMLLLARSDPDAIDDQRVKGVDLGELVREAVLELVPRARKRSIELRFDHSAGRVFVAGNNLLLHELVVNLVDNALRHGREGGVVTVRVNGYPKACLEVEDDGPGIPEEERERVFDRFYRGRHTTATGSGLGLPIAHNICSAHRASLVLLTPTSGAGLLVRVTFNPRPERPAQDQSCELPRDLR